MRHSAWRIARSILRRLGMFKKSELERLFATHTQAGFHPARPLLTHETVGEIALGINPDEQPRSG